MFRLKQTWHDRNSWEESEGFLVTASSVWTLNIITPNNNMILECIERNKANTSMEVVAVCHSLLWADWFWRTAPGILASYFIDQVQGEGTQSEDDSGNAVVLSLLRKLWGLSLKQEVLVAACSPHCALTLEGSLWGKGHRFIPWYSRKGKIRMNEWMGVTGKSSPLYRKEFSKINII